jgi:hypothetical protein
MLCNVAVCYISVDLAASIFMVKSVRINNKYYKILTNTYKEN